MRRDFDAEERRMNWLFGLGIVAIIGGIVAIAALVPVYSVWTAEQEGKAILAKAEYSKKAQVADAEAKYQSAKYLKQAADEIQSGLSAEYLEFLRIQMMETVGERNEHAVYFYGGSQAPAPVVPAR
jgi:hypothetical protein